MRLPYVPEIDDHYIRSIVFDNAATWVDEIYFDLRIDFENLQLDRKLEQYEFCQTKHVWAEKVSIVLALKAMIDTICTAPWCGVSLDRLTSVVEDLLSEIESGALEVVSPITKSLGDTKSCRLHVPFWSSGHQGNFSIVIGGNFERLNCDLDSLTADFVKTADIMAAALAGIRAQEAREMMLAHGINGGGRLHPDGLLDAINHMIAPHNLLNAEVGGQLIFQANEVNVKNTHSFDISYGKNNASFVFQVFEECDIFDLHTEPLCIKNRIDSVFYDYITLQSGVASTVSVGSVRANDVYEQAKQILEENRNRVVSTKDYLLCFVAHALLSKEGKSRFQVRGTRVRTHQEDLMTKYAIGRRTRNGEVEGQASDSAGQANVLSIAQMATSPDSLREVEQAFGNAIALERSYGELNVTVL